MSSPLILAPAATRPRWVFVSPTALCWSVALGLTLGQGSLPLAAVLAAPAAKPAAAAKPGAKPAAPAPKPAVKPAPKPTPKPVPKPTPKPALRPAAPAAPLAPADQGEAPAAPGPAPVAAPPAAPPPAPVPVAAGPRTWALLVGVGTYQNPQIASLKFPAKDATALRDALTDATLGGLPPDNVLLLTDGAATKEAIHGAVESFLRPKVKAGDKVIVFLAGHGIAKGVGTEARSYLLPTDTRGLTTPALDASAVNLRTLADSLGQLPASQFVVFVDACREDPTPGRGIKGNTLSDVFSRGIQVLPSQRGAESATFFACRVGQRAYEDANLGHGVFTSGILEGLRGGQVAQKPDGAVDMGRLSSFVSYKVEEWARKASAAGDFELQQTPELVSPGLDEPLVLMKVKRPLPEVPFAPAKPRVTVATFPDVATVAINGRTVGTGVVQNDLAPGENTITISAPGYAPVARTVKGFGGYQQELVVQLQPAAAGGGTAAADDPANDFFQRAVAAENRQQWEIAEQGYQAAIGANARFLPAYYALMELHRLQNRNVDALGDALVLLAQTPRSAASLALLSRSYSRYAERGAGKENALNSLTAVSGYGLPRNPEDAVSMAQKAANEAVSVDANSAAASLAQGYALCALDTKGKNKRAALAAFGKAAFLDAKDANNHLGLGYGIRYYAVQQKKDEDKRAELGRAVSTLQEAAHLRPNSYDVHRELGICYTLLDQADNALRAYEIANANRGAASDANEVAANDMAMSGLHMKVAQNSSGEKKQAHMAASEGCAQDAKETAPDMKVAMQILNNAGVSTTLQSYIPAEFRPLMDVRGSVESEIRRKLPGGMKLPF